MHVLNFSIDFQTDPGEETTPRNLVVEIVDADGRAYFRIIGRRRAWLVPGTIGVHLIPLARLGYPGVTSVDNIANLFLQPQGLIREPITTISAPSFLPDVMASGFTFSDWNAVTGFNIAVGTPPVSPAAILSYKVAVEGSTFWSAIIPVGDLPKDIPFEPTVYSDWQFGVATWDVELTIAATIAAGTAPASSGTVKTITNTNVYFVPAADWSLASIDTVGPVGQVDMTLSGASVFAPPSPWVIRGQVGTSADIIDPTLVNTFPIALGQTVRVATGIVNGQSAFGMIHLHNSNTGQFRPATVAESVTVLALSIGPPPATINGPIITGRVSHGGTLKADISVALSGDVTDWTGTPTGRTNQFQINAVPVGTLATDAAAAYSPVAGDDGKNLTLKSTATNANGMTQVESAAVSVVRIAPGLTGAGIANVEYVTSSGVQTIAAATVAAAFTGPALVYSMASSVGTINASTGAISFPSQPTASSQTITVTAANSGGSAAVSLTATFALPGALFPPAISDTLWSVEELTDSVEAGGVVGRRRVITDVSIVVPGTHTLLMYAGTADTPPWSVTTQEISPGTPFTTVGGHPVGTVIFPKLGWRRLAGNTFQTAGERPSFPIVGFDAPASPLINTPFAASQLTQAINKSQTDFAPYDNVGTNGGSFGSTIVVEAYEAFRGNAAAVAPTLTQLRYNLQGAHCPAGYGGFEAQMELRFIAMAALAKKTPAVWSQLTPTEITKIDLLVKVLAVCGAYCCSTKNPDILANVANPIRSMTAAPNWYNTNPNFSCAPPALVALASCYLGAGALSTFFNTLSIANMITQLSANGLTNALNLYNTFPVTGSVTGKGDRPAINPPPSRVQIQNAVANWVCATPDYIGQTVASGQAVAISSINRFASKTIMSGYGGNAGNGWIGPGYQGWAMISSGAAQTPNLGQLGMAHEFNSSDGLGIRSAMRPYVMFGMRIVLEQLLTQAAYGELDRTSGPLQTAVARMNRSMIDIDYKSEQGYRNFEKGSGNEWSEADLGATWGMISSLGPRVRGYTLGFWFNVLHPWLTA